jgi:lon-related putative ATP-dependent protease
MNMITKLTIEQIRKECDPKFLSCKTTKELTPLEEIIGQERAVRALKFGLGIKEKGFNIYVAGYPGTGRTTAVINFLDESARSQPVPPDWCYVNNFSNQYAPKVLRLSPGKGKEFQKDMKEFIEKAKRNLPKAFESDDYNVKRESTIKTMEAQRKTLLEQLNIEARKEGFIIQISPIGLFLVPVIKGKPASDEEIIALPLKLREEIRTKKERLETQMRSVTRQFMDMERKIEEEINKLNRDIALYSIGHLMADLKEKYNEVPDVLPYLDEVQKDILDNILQFIREPESDQQLPFTASWLAEAPFKKYEVNCIVDNEHHMGAPVIIELNPTFQNLFGKIEKEAQFGALITDFTMIRPGSMHKANGGYLVIPVEALLTNPFAYDGLKRALKNGELGVEEIEERLGFITTKSVKPSPIHLEVKVILIGDPYLYQQLFVLDMEFNELFKVKADFDTSMPRNDENTQQYAGFVCKLCQKEHLLHLDGSGLAKLIEHSSRMAADQNKLSTRFAEIADIIREANYYALQEKSELISANQVKKAIEEKSYRSRLIQEKIQEMINRGFLLIDTETSMIGQVNGLSVMGFGDFSFGGPSRVTASIGVGREGIIDIEREAKLGGPIHTKGVLILSGYINTKYAQDKPLSLSARLVFEQNYAGVEGDSASSTELYAILSALAGLPIKQSFAVTGSVNQKGEIQAIGGVNEKIEGFYEVCKLKGLTGKQGVMIPESNVQNLMVKDEIVEEVKKGKFHLYSVKTIDEGIELLTGVKAGERRKDGTFEEGTVHDRVDKRLQEMAEKLRQFPSVSVDLKNNK